MVLRVSNKYKDRTGRAKLFYQCSGRDCRETHGAHPNGKPIGIPANREIRALREYVHELAKRIWPWENKKEVRKMYEWMEANTRSGHISKMLEWELIDLEHKLIEIINKKL